MSTKESLNKLLGLFGAIKGLEYLIIVYMFASVFGSYMSQMAKGREKVLEIGVAGILGTIAAVALNIYLLLYLKLGFIGFFWASILFSAVQIIYYAIKLKLWQLIKFSIITKRLVKEMVFYSFPVILTSLGWMLNHAADKYVVTMFCGVAMNGLLPFPIRFKPL